MDITHKLATKNGTSKSTPPAEPVVQAQDVVELLAGSFLFRKGDLAENIFFLQSGQITILEETDTGERVAIDRVEVGEPVGELELILGGKRKRFARADADCELSAIPFSQFETQANEDPTLMQRVGEFARRRTEQGHLLSSLQSLFGDPAGEIFKLIEPDLTWTRLADGDWLEQPEGLYFLVTGRLQMVVNDKVRDEISTGGTVGETSLIAGRPNEARYQAMHDTTLAQISPALFEQMIETHPITYQTLSKKAVNSLHDVINDHFDADSLVTIAIIPVNGSKHAQTFCKQLAEALESHGETIHLNSSRVDALSDQPEWSQTSPENPWSIRLTSWLDQQESTHRFVIYEADTSVSEWTRRAVLRAEHVLIVGDFQSDNQLSEIERQLLTPKTLETVRRRALVLLYPYVNQRPRNTRSWLDQRNLENVHHVRMHMPEDVERIARVMANCSVGLVLGGGGARGFAHVGVIKAFEELQIPIDFIGGTSSGGMAAATYAFGYDANGIAEMIQESLIRRNPFKSYTMPIMSLVNSKTLDDAYRNFWGDADIADLWIPYFSITADITSSNMIVQRTGKVWQSVRATSSVPGVVVPLIREGNLMIDGGVMDNVPVATMRSLNRGPTITVDVAPEGDMRSEFEYEELPSPWQLLRKRFSPFAQTLKTFTISDVMMQSIVVNSVSRKSEAKELSDVWLNPDCSDYGMMDITQQALDEMIAIGHRHALESRGELLQLFNRTDTDASLSPSAVAVGEAPSAAQIVQLYETLDPIKQKELGQALQALLKGDGDQKTQVHPKNKTHRAIGRLIFSALDVNGESKPIHSMRVELWDRDIGNPDDLLGDGFTDKLGEFEIWYDPADAGWRDLPDLELRVLEPQHTFNLSGGIEITYKQIFAMPGDNNVTVQTYNFGDIAVSYWEYDPNKIAPRVHVPEYSDPPEKYALGRTVSLYKTLGRFSSIKLKHKFIHKRNPDQLTVDNVQSDYPVPLTVELEEKNPGITRSDAYFGERILNGISAGILDKDRNYPGWYRLFHHWNAYEQDGVHCLPNVDMRFEMQGGKLMPVQITLQMRERGATEAHAPLDEPMTFTPADGERWEQAKRVARVSSGLSAELDAHLSMTHWNIEQYTIACNRNLRLNPLRFLLHPHLKEVVIVNHRSDSILIGPDGFMPRACGLTHESIEQRLTDTLGTFDWKNWQPRRVISEDHSFAKIGWVMWELLGKYVDSYFELYHDEIVAHWHEVHSFSQDLVNNSAPLKPTHIGSIDWYWHEEDYPTEQPDLADYGDWNDWFDENERIDLTVKREVVNGVTKVISPITKRDIPEAEDIENMKQVARYTLMLATYVHAYTNSKQYDDAGEIKYSCMGLRWGDNGVFVPEDDDSVAPSVMVASEHLWFGNLLTKCNYGFIMQNEDRDLHPLLLDIFREYRPKFEALGYDIEKLQSRTNN